MYYVFTHLQLSEILQLSTKNKYIKYRYVRFEMKASCVDEGKSMKWARASKKDRLVLQ